MAFPVDELAYIKMGINVDDAYFPICNGVP
jgi:hypothetical protein